ncbi:MAG TPA: hypothetical protein ENN17_04630 [bacterium]|nr:hypothetical protein [bacterium]
MIAHFRPGWLEFFSLLSLLLFGIGQTETPATRRAALGIEIGNWQPHSLNDDPQFNTFGAAGATPSYGVNLSLPVGEYLGLRIAAGYWALYDLNETEAVHKLSLHSLCLDLKMLLVPDNRVSAFVMYGGGVYWGTENETTPFGSKLSSARPGWGANLGAGVDFALFRQMGVGLLFQYHFVRFETPLGGVTDFSGPKVGIGIHRHL